MLHRRFVLFRTPIPRCSSSHCLDSVGFICPRTNKNHGNVFQEYIPITVSLRFPFGDSEPKHPDEDNKLSPEPSMPTHWWQHNQWDSNPQSPTRKVGALNQFGHGRKIKTGMGGFEPPTIRLTAERSTTKLHANKIRKTRRGGTLPPTNDCMEKVWWLAPIRNGSSSCAPSRLLPFCLSYQEGRIWTCDPLVPNQVLWPNWATSCRVTPGWGLHMYGAICKVRKSW